MLHSNNITNEITSSETNQSLVLDNYHFDSESDKSAFKNVKTLVIKNSSGLDTDVLSQFTSAESIEIIETECNTSLSFNENKKLERIIIKSCHSIAYLMFNLGTLSSIQLNDCIGLMSLEAENTDKLKFVEINNSKKNG